MKQCYIRLLAVVIVVVGSAGHAAEEATAKFFRGLNLNGPPVTIDGYAWEGKESPNYACQDKAFENQTVNLLPSTDPERAKMIRSSRWGGNRVELSNMPAGRYTVFLYVWEDNQPEIYNVSVNDQEVLKGYNSRREGHWDKLGPWVTDSKNGQIVLTTTGGTANLSGIEIWLGEHDGANFAPIPDEQQAFFETRIRPLCGPPNSAERPPKRGTTGEGIMVPVFQSGWLAEGSKGGWFTARLTRSAKRSPVTQSTCTTCTRRSCIKWGSITRG